MAPHAAEEISPDITTTKVVTNGATNGVTNGVTNGKPVQREFKGPVHDFYYPPVISPEATYEVLQQYHSKPTKLRVACIGAGASGLCLGYKMGKQMVPDSWELTMFEKNHHFGGTWLENTYPGVACDVRLPAPLLDGLANIS